MGGGEGQEKGKSPNLEKHPGFPVRLLRKIQCLQSIFQGSELGAEIENGS